jgi:hypothetical protein
MHLLFGYAQPMWELAGGITTLIRQTSMTAQTDQIHAHSAMNNKHDGQVMAWFQEIADLKEGCSESSSLTGGSC